MNKPIFVLMILGMSLLSSFSSSAICFGRTDDLFNHTDKISLSTSMFPTQLSVYGGWSALERRNVS